MKKLFHYVTYDKTMTYNIKEKRKGLTDDSAGNPPPVASLMNGINMDNKRYYYSLVRQHMFQIPPYAYTLMMTYYIMVSIVWFPFPLLSHPPTTGRTNK